MIDKNELMKELDKLHEDGVYLAEARKAASKAESIDEAICLYEAEVAKKEGKQMPELQAWLKWNSLYVQACEKASERAEIGETSADKIFELIEDAQNGLSQNYEVCLTKAIRRLKAEAAQYEELAKKWRESMRQPWPVWPWC